MPELLERLMLWLSSKEGKKILRYSMVSVISTGVSFSVLFLVYGVGRLWTEVPSTVFANVVATFPSYWLNRNWAWGKSGRSHLVKEVLPFWFLAIVGLVFSTWAVDFTHTHIAGIQNHAEHTAILAAAYLGSFGTLWLAKFMIFNRFLF